MLLLDAMQPVPLKATFGQACMPIYVLGYSSLKSYRGTDDILCMPPDNH